MTTYEKIQLLFAQNANKPVDLIDIAVGVREMDRAAGRKPVTMHSISTVAWLMQSQDKLVEVHQNEKACLKLKDSEYAKLNTA